MITSYPVGAHPADPARRPAAPRTPTPNSPLPVIAGAWRYRASNGSRKALLCSALLSAGLHAAFLFGFGGGPKKIVKVVEEPVPVLQLVMPELKELEEPETFRDDDGRQTEDFSAPVPMQADVPSLPQLTDFVQQMDYSSLLPPPDLSQAKMLTIPDTIRRGGKVLDIGKIFNLADLDRIPEATFQTPPLYPQSLKREGLTATVVVEFIVDTEGRVLNANAVDATHPGFIENAIRGVERWRFRPGMRGGRKVNTRMRAPIIFKIVDNE